MAALHERLAPYLREHDAALTGTLLWLRGWALWCLNALGDGSVQAIEYGQDVVADFQRVLSEDHASTLFSRNNLVSADQNARDHAKLVNAISIGAVPSLAG